MNNRITIDDKLIDKLKKGDVKSFHWLYDSLSPAMRLICKRYVKTDADAEDVFQDGFLKIYANISSLKCPKAFMGWMKRIFINTALDYYKKESGRRSESIDDIIESRIEDQNNTDDDWDENSLNNANVNYNAILHVDFTQEEMLTALNVIPGHFRIVFQLHVIDGYKHQEIAEMISINEKTSKTRLLRARTLLKEELNRMAIRKIRDGQSG
ncbi:MAG: RNA polymerase sigma factor [Bacteroidales bacterium]|nr:RNA polymerase sigma factor [Bacteroidales bacterium]